MTVRLLADYPYSGALTIPAGRVVAFDAATETGLIAAKLAVSTASPIDWEPPLEPAASPFDARLFRMPGGKILSLLPDGSVAALYEPWPVATLTATGSAANAACEYGGVKVRAVSSTVNLVLYDALSATGTPIDTISGLSLTGGPNGDGYYPWSSLGGARINGTGLWVVFSGGGTATVDVLRRLS
ncbi:MAG: hypothetical protein KF683_01205 [Rubrivivax sp.]|nr:hypothetical protein [Rubrivivax sp.]